MTEDNASVAAELDAEHRRAKANYQAKDLDAYMSVFAPDLRYKQPDGRTIGREELARDVESQMSAVVSTHSSYVRETLVVHGDRATEVLFQKAFVTSRRLVLFRRSWRVERRGRYEWVRLPEGWRIQEVEVLVENVVHGAA
jgi:ketosteroid isomerase-like protein